MNQTMYRLFPCFLVLISSCMSPAHRPSNATADPFEGFFAHPSVCALELHRDPADGVYRGSLWADFGPFPVEATRKDNKLVGTVSYNRQDMKPSTFEVESTAQGLIVSTAGNRGSAPLKRY